MGEGGGGEEIGSFSPSALFLFRLHLSPFPPETSDTQACIVTMCCALYAGRLLALINLNFRRAFDPLRASVARGEKRVRDQTRRRSARGELS